MTKGAKIASSVARVRSDLTLGMIDLILTAGSYLVVLLLRFDGFVPPMQWQRFESFLPVALIVHIFANLAWGVYGQMWRHASMEEARKVLFAGASTMGVLEVMKVLELVTVPQSVVVFGALMTTCLTGVIRFQSRLFALHRSSRGREGLRVIVLGAGDAGASIVREMQRRTQSGFVPLGFLDDDPRKQGRLLAGLPVLGRLDSLTRISPQLGLHQAVLAIPSATPEVVRQAARDAEEAGVGLKVLPPVTEMLSGHPSVRDVRDLQIEDLLGRNQVSTDLDAVRRLLAGRRVLITGAGGSIGSEIARQVADCAPGTLVLVDHDETHLHDAIALLDAPAVEILADVRDAERIDEIFRRHQPEVVFHAAAHKHVPILERHPSEAVRTNVVGTANVVAAAAKHDVKHLVFISTDKAVRPRSVMGATKWLGEQLILRNTPPDRAWCAVRFGNVVGSRGSVIPTFTRQILAGGPVTVTDQNMTRFFMSVQESVQLVLQSAVFSRGGEVFMLDMGEPVNIYELAKRMIRLSGRGQPDDVAIEIVGPRPGEKLEEELRTAAEHPQATPHPAIVCLYPIRVPEDRLDPTLPLLCELSTLGRDEDVAELLFDLSASISSSPATTSEVVVDLVGGGTEGPGTRRLDGIAAPPPHEQAPAGGYRP